MDGSSENEIVKHNISEVSSSVAELEKERSVPTDAQVSTDCNKIEPRSEIVHQSHASGSDNVEAVKYSGESSLGGESSPLLGDSEKLECRICQEEDSVSNLEAPCDCAGSLKVIPSINSQDFKQCFICTILVTIC